MHYENRFRFVFSVLRAHSKSISESIKGRFFGDFSRRWGFLGKIAMSAPRSVEHEASRWIARLNSDDVSPSDSARFEAWRKKHPLHARAYADLFATWRSLVAVGPANEN